MPQYRCGRSRTTLNNKETIRPFFFVRDPPKLLTDILLCFNKIY
ncbi:hypothetical protein LFML04_1362 [Leptospirillum ferriphilum ML-04]|uniref:Uncharacterized protein n=1 Tax=Leptospirillum ferriphilum (strain ML-04) TaxID=1048260 RepID=J9ZBM2_LEPFM|nr:hypothetical protein LFML04_1362 [Leptospirillum ferriphilum ML-04]